LMFASFVFAVRLRRKSTPLLFFRVVSASLCLRGET